MNNKLIRLMVALPVLLLPALVQAQDAYSTNADGSIYTYSTNADGSANIVAYAGPPWVVTIPTNIDSLAVTSIGEYAFEGDNLTNITIPDSVTSIGGEAFNFCTNLSSVTIGTNVTSIGYYAFNACSSLTSVTIGSGVINIGAEAFLGCYDLTNVIIPASVTSIGGAAFGDCTNLSSVTIGTNVTNIGEFAFDECYSLTCITIPDSVTSIGEEAFDECTSLTSVTIPDGVTSIGGGAFGDDYNLTAIMVDTNNPAYSSLNGVLFDKSQATLIEYPDGLIGGSYTIPNSVTSIGNGAFSTCTSLTSVTIPDSVTSIGRGAFEDDYNLARVYFTGNAPSPNNNSFVFSEDPATVYYLPGTTGWGAMFDGQPTAPWFLPNPLILNNGPGFGVQPGGFGFTISWATNASVVVETATNLANPVWLPVSTNPLTNGTNYFSDPQWTNYPGRFYRVQLSP